MSRHSDVLVGMILSLTVQYHFFFSDCQHNVVKCTTSSSPLSPCMGPLSRVSHHGRLLCISDVMFTSINSVQELRFPCGFPDLTLLPLRLSSTITHTLTNTGEHPLPRGTPHLTGLTFRKLPHHERKPPNELAVPFDPS